MDIVQARAIPLNRVFAIWDLRPAPTLKGLQLYSSPFNPEQKTMLVVNPSTNRWIDPVTGKEGSTVELIVCYLESQHLQHSVVDALRWLRNMVGQEYHRLEPPAGMPDHQAHDSLFRIKDCTYLSDSLLMQYVEEARGIPFHIASLFFKQVTVFNQSNGKSFIALGTENEEGGIAVRNPYHKANIKPLYTSFIRGQQVKPDGIHLFKDFFDFLSILTQRQGKPFDDDVLILNHLSMMKLSSAFIRGYGYKYAYTWLDNDHLGKEATKRYASFFRTEPGLKHRPMNHLYQGYKDVNDWHVATSRAI